ncbi:MAG: DinB family protein [Acidobacteriia bacterium]|nr:DinB family protein [Terriglobia bacterium]
MKSRAVVALAVVVALSLFAADAAAVPANAAGEYAKHFGALSKLSVEVAQAMPPEQYAFRPHPDSMDFGRLMSHIATTNYQFCAGLKDSDPPALPSPTEKDAVVKFLSDSFDYCSAVIPNLTEEQLSTAHNSPDGRLLGREILLAMYIHVAHHRGQAEIYLRDKGIKPPSYRI